MNVFSDKYHFRTRIIPQFLMVLPLCLLFLFYTDLKINPAFYLTVLLVVFVSWNFASQCGRKLEHKYKETGDIEFLDVHIKKIYKKDASSRDVYEIFHLNAFEEVRKRIGLNDSFPELEENMQELQLQKIENWLRENTRDKEKFPAVFDKNCSYGFQRNMLAMRGFATALNALSICLLFLPFLIDACFSFNFYDYIGRKINYASIGFFTFSLLVLESMWFVAISLNLLKKASWGYTDALLRAVDGIEKKLQ